MATPNTSESPIGERLRRHRIETLKIGLREMAKKLAITAPYLSDLEMGRRSPSDDLLILMADKYGIAEAELRAGWGKAETDVGRIASSNPVAASRAPELLRTASGFDQAQWDALIEQARKLAARTPSKSKTS